MNAISMNAPTHGNQKLSKNQVGEMFEEFISGALDVDGICEKYNIGKATASQYIYINYYGIVAKSRQITITLESKV